MSALSGQADVARTRDAMSADDPGCVKTLRWK
jgi:hypothetical protein